MSAQVYNGFGSIENKNKYICKSEITRANMRKMGFSEKTSVEEVKSAFDELDGIYVRRGNQYKNRVTKYVKKFELYLYVVKGRRLNNY